MSEIIEAKSLSALTTLASNPPRYPRNPTHERHDPLVLYIARVPGSRDVFLTPIKPRQKVVTAEDVQSSLYYIHFDNPDDQLLRAEAELEDELFTPEPQGSPVKDQLPILRKPLSRPLPPLPVDDAQARLPSIRRKPVAPPVLSIRQDMENEFNIPAPLKPRASPPVRSTRQDIENELNILAPVKPRISPPPRSSREDIENGLNILAPMKTRAPPGTERMPHQRGMSYELPSRHSESLRPALPNRRWSAQPPPRGELPPQWSRSFSPRVSGRYDINPADRLPDQSPYLDPYAHVAEEHPTPSPLPSTAQPDQAEGCISLTLIRRDPSSGAQWNVGKIKDPPVFSISSETSGSSSTQRTRRPGTPMYLEINNPGYTKFLAGQQENVLYPQARSSQDSMRSFSASLSESSYTSVSQASTVDTTFRRRICFENSRYSSDYFGHRKTSSQSCIYNLDVPSPSIARSPLSPIEDDRQSIGMPPQDRKSGFRGYAFQSPWNGRCEFVTGASGSSLKCKHILPVSNGALQPSQAVMVSELRFNLPATRGTPSTPIEDGSSKRSSFFARPPMRRQLSGMSISESLDGSGRWQDILAGVSNLDLSLGQEYAGGGFGGKQAKLGKLIIQDEGLKMLDLIVAANMSIWWRAYGKVDSSGR